MSTLPDSPAPGPESPGPADSTLELRQAATWQDRVIPRVVPRVEGLDLFAHMEPASIVGGDDFEFIPDGPHGTYLFIADAAGHGLEAALFVSTARAMLRALLSARRGPPLPVLVQALNQRLVEDAEASGLFVTALLARYDAISRTVAYVNCGHPPPLLVRGAAFVVLPDAIVPPLGVLDSFDAEAGIVRLSPGDLLCFHTDGLVEARNPAGEMLGLARVAHALTTSSAIALSQIARGLLDVGRAHRQEVPFEDDVTIVLARQQA